MRTTTMPTQAGVLREILPTFPIVNPQSKPSQVKFFFGFLPLTLLRLAAAPCNHSQPARPSTAGLQLCSIPRAVTIKYGVP